MQSWLGRRTCRKKEIESLVGKLSHASKVIQPGKTFLRQLFEVIGGARKSFHHIRLNAATRSDIAWWATFAQAWNGVLLIKEYGVEHVDHCVATDALGRFGCGGLWQNKWFQIAGVSDRKRMSATGKHNASRIVASGNCWSHLGSTVEKLLRQVLL